MINNMDYVDLGLPSGTLWAKCNYGANKETESGGFYTWDVSKELPITLPTKEQYVELIERTTSKWVNNYKNSGINGRLFISKKNGKSIFIPAAGCCNLSSVNYVGSIGFVWSSSFNSSYPYGVYYLFFSNSSVNPQHYNSRIYGFSVRSILNK